MVEEVLLPFLLKSCSGSNPLDHQPGVHKMLDLMWVCMEVSPFCRHFVRFTYRISVKSCGTYCNREL